MKTFARINKNNNVVINIEQFDDNNLPVDDDEFYFIESTETNPAYINGDYFNNLFYPIQPYPSWIRTNNGRWESPVPQPVDEINIWHEWDEGNQTWVKHIKKDIIIDSDGKLI